MTVFVIAKELPEFLHSGLLVFALNDGALVHADANGDARVFARIDDAVDLLTVGDIAGVEADLVDAGLH